MKYNKDVIEAAMRAWNQMGDRLDPKQKLYGDFDEFKEFYKGFITTLLEEEGEQ